MTAPTRAGFVVLAILLGPALCPLMAARPMPLGVNFIPPGWGEWTLEQGSWADIFAEGWQNVSGNQPVFKPELIEELGAYSGPLRFMEAGAVNRAISNSYHQSGRWADRKPKTDREQYEPVAFEYQIDLCNASDRDFWVNAPCTADDDYFVQLATLIKTRLNANLKCYVEWANEVWNFAGGFESGTYADQKVSELGISGNQIQSRARYTTLRSFELFAAFDSVFSDQLSRVVKVIPGWMGHDYAEVQFAAFDDPRYNPDGIQVDAYALPAYVGGGNGADPGIFDYLENVLQTSAKPSWQRALNLCTPRGIDLMAYECGLHTTDNPQPMVTDPDVYDWIYHYYSEASEYFSVMVHYCHCGMYTWHAKLYVGQAESEAHIYRAIKDWVSQYPLGTEPLYRIARSSSTPRHAAHAFHLVGDGPAPGALNSGAAQLSTLQGRTLSVGGACCSGNVDVSHGLYLQQTTSRHKDR